MGSIAVAPLLTRYRTKTILAWAIAIFAVISSLGMVLELATHGSWDPRLILPIFTVAGVAHGMVEIIRRVLPRDLVGGEVRKLRRLDATVHIFYEVAGTAGAFFAAFMALTVGKALAPVATPACFLVAAVLWSRMRIAVPDEPSSSSPSQPGGSVAPHARPGFVASLGRAFLGFGRSVTLGARLVCTDRRFTWLLLGYSVPLVLHRYIENGVAPNYAQLVLHEAAYAPILVGGSNFGELCGAGLVLLLTTPPIHTPLPWLRLDALTLTVAWVYGAVTPASLGASPLATACVMAAVMAPIAVGWAAGDVSLSAFIQSRVSRLPGHHGVSVLGAVMGFLYVTYIVLYAIVSPVIGRWLDSMSADPVLQREQYFKYIPGVAFSSVALLIFASTFWPRGSCALNPTLEEEYPEEADEPMPEAHDELASLNLDIPRA